VSGGGGADSSWKAWLTTSGEFVKEARYDLMVAEVLLRDERFKLDKCRNGGDAFYLGRRALYTLQQAVEKAAKAYFISFGVALDKLAKLLNGRRRVSHITVKKLRDLSNKLMYPREISHKVHNRLVKVAEELIELRTREAFASSFERVGDLLPKLLSEEFKEIKRQNPQIKQVIEVLEPCITSKAVESVKSMAVAYREFKPEEFKKPENIQRVPPCIDPSFLSVLKGWRLVMQRVINSCEEKLREMLGECLKNAPIEGSTIENLLSPHINGIKALCFGHFMFLYLAPFIKYAYPCLYWYEKGGRYPDSSIHGHVFVYEKREEVCRDLENVGQLAEEVRHIVEAAERFVEEGWKRFTLGPV